VCLGIVGRVTALSTTHPDLADVDVAGLVRLINVGLLEGTDLQPGDWILIHAGFAMERIDRETAARQIAALRDYVGEPEDGDGEFG
jgi:hydrogenase expression/formation protein HypC